MSGKTPVKLAGGSSDLSRLSAGTDRSNEPWRVSIHIWAWESWGDQEKICRRMWVESIRLLAGLRGKAGMRLRHGIIIPFRPSSGGSMASWT